MNPLERPRLRVVSISGAAGQRLSERLRLAALAERSDIALSVLIPVVRNGALALRAGVAEAAAVDDRFQAICARRWVRRIVSGRLDTIPHLGETIATLQPDVIHVHQEPGSLLALQAVRLRDQLAPAAAVLVESEQADMDLTSGLTTQLEKHVLRRADALLVRHKVRLELSRAQGFAGHGIVLGYGIDGRVFRPGLRRAARDAMGVSGFTIGYIGRLVPESGLTDVLEAIKAARVPVNLIIKDQSGLTSGSMRDEIVDRALSLDIADRVRILGPGEAPDDVTFLSTLDALVLMRRSVRRWREPFEHVIPEAQACGVPVIASGLSGIPTLVGAGGWIVGERDAGLLARLLHHLATQPEVTEAVAAAALAHIAQHGWLESVTQELRRAFDTAIQARRLRRARAPRWLGLPSVRESYRR
jgi:glycosyltransferase involved in cell wall biosynthesis